MFWSKEDQGEMISELFPCIFLKPQKVEELRDWDNIFPILPFIFICMLYVIPFNGLLIFRPSSEFACSTVTFVTIACPQGRARDAICGDNRPGDRLLKSGHSVYTFCLDFALHIRFPSIFYIIPMFHIVCLPLLR